MTDTSEREKPNRGINLVGRLRSSCPACHGQGEIGDGHGAAACDACGGAGVLITEILPPDFILKDDLS